MRHLICGVFANSRRKLFIREESEVGKTRYYEIGREY